MLFWEDLVNILGGNGFSEHLGEIVWVDTHEHRCSVMHCNICVISHGADNPGKVTINCHLFIILLSSGWGHLGPKKFSVTL